MARSLDNELKTPDKYCLAGYQLKDPKLALGKDFEHNLYDIQIIERKEGKLVENFAGPIEIVYKMTANEESSKPGQQLKVNRLDATEFLKTKNLHQNLENPIVSIYLVWYYIGILNLSQEKSYDENMS